jgi:hypothetical protein
LRAGDKILPGDHHRDRKSKGKVEIFLIVHDDLWSSGEEPDRNPMSRPAMLWGGSVKSGLLPE